jgi:hypothetical protein
MKDDVIEALRRLLVDLECPRCLDEWAPWRHAPALRVVAAGAKDDREADLKKAA